MRCACGLSSASRITLIPGYFFLLLLAFGSAGMAGGAVGGAPGRASGWVSSAEGPFTGATVTSPEKPAASAGTGTFLGISRLGFSMVGVPLLAAALTSGPRRMKLVAL